MVAIRSFRTVESLEAERITRRLIPEYLSRRGFRDVQNHDKRVGTSISQTIKALSPQGEQLSIRVKLCWRTSNQKANRLYSAAQLFARIRTGNWEDELHAFVARAQAEGITHFLFAQRHEAEISHAALVPAKELIRVWCAQRDISQKLIREGRLGKRRKNHAMNGSSPTLWLLDSVAPEVGNVLWRNPRVQNLNELGVHPIEILDDTYADLDGIDASLLGREGAEKLGGTGRL